jgi:hypothetical protein
MLRQHEQNDVSLGVFLSPNAKLLAAFSILGALTLLFTFFTNELLYYISLFLFLVLGYEFNTRFPSWRLSTPYLFLFRILCIVLFVGVNTYSSYFYVFINRSLLSFLILLLVHMYVWFASPRIKRFVHQHKK